MAHVDGVHAFGDNSAGSEAIWMKIWGSLSILSAAGPGKGHIADLPSPVKLHWTVDHVRVLVYVTFSCDLRLDKHVSTVLLTTLLHQLRGVRVRRSLDDECMKTMVHAFVTTRVDFCNTVFASTPRSVTDKLQRAMNAAARIVSDTRKYDRGLSQLIHVDLHWLDVSDRVKFKLGLTVHRCLSNKAPHYLADYIASPSSPTSPVGSGDAQLNVAIWMYHDTTAAHLLGRRSFSVAGPTVWNSLPDALRDQGCIEGTFNSRWRQLFTQH